MMNLFGDCGMVSDRRRDLSWLLGSALGDVAPGDEDYGPATPETGDVGQRLASLGYDNLADYQRDTGIGPGDGTLTPATLDSLKSNSTPLVSSGPGNVGITSGKLPPVPPNPSPPVGPNLQQLLRQDAAGVVFDVTAAGPSPTSSDGSTGLILAGAAALLGVALLRRRGRR
jgi:hypothetical protein